MTTIFSQRSFSKAPRDTFEFASQFARKLKAGDLVLLQGDLGAGKTQFARGVCAGLGLKDLWEVDSPTYTLLNHYEVGPGVDHLDLYRLEGKNFFDEIHFDDLLQTLTIKIIEWPERLKNYPLTSPFYLVNIEIQDADQRVIQIRQSVLE